jgi:hypothetical protein
VLEGALVAELTSCAVDTQVIRRNRPCPVRLDCRILDPATVRSRTIGKAVARIRVPVGNILSGVLQVVGRRALDGRPATIRMLLPLAVVLAVDVDGRREAQSPAQPGSSQCYKGSLVDRLFTVGVGEETRSMRKMQLPRTTAASSSSISASSRASPARSGRQGTGVSCRLERNDVGADRRASGHLAASGLLRRDAGRGKIW